MQLLSTGLKKLKKKILGREPGCLKSRKSVMSMWFDFISSRSKDLFPSTKNWLIEALTTPRFRCNGDPVAKHLLKSPIFICLGSIISWIFTWNEESFQLSIIPGVYKSWGLVTSKEGIKTLLNRHSSRVLRSTFGIMNRRSLDMSSHYTKEPISWLICPTSQGRKMYFQIHEHEKPDAAPPFFIWLGHNSITIAPHCSTLGC